MDSIGIHGVDLRYEHRDYAIAQDHGLSTDVLLKHNPDADVSRYPTTERSVIHDGKFKLRLNKEGSVLYRLPNETTDVSSQFPAVADELESKLTD